MSNEQTPSTSSIPFDPEKCPYDCAFCYKKPDQKLVIGLDNDIDEIRKQVVRIKESASTDTKLKPILAALEEATRTINQASAKSKELTADVVLPSKKTMAVHLVPSHLFERLEEYRNDENKAFLLIGAFFGAILGILSNWATNENFIITRFSLVLMGMFFFLALLSITWAILISRRAQKAKQNMLSE